MVQQSVDFSWEEAFPPVFGHTSIAYLKNCPGFDAAKNGDINAAMAVISLCVKPRRIRELCEKYPTAVLLPIMSENKLPEALARAIGLRTCSDVIEAVTVSRKSMSAMERLLHKPIFCGRVSQGERYILVDDIVTQGGTVSALRQFTLIGGGSVIAVTALACSIGSHKIAPSLTVILSLMEKFNLIQIVEMLQKYRIADNLFDLTHSQASYLLRFREVARINRKISMYTERLPKLFAWRADNARYGTSIVCSSLSARANGRAAPNDHQTNN